MLLHCAIESVVFADESAKIVDNHHTLWINVDNPRMLAMLHLAYLDLSRFAE